jgi:hypothetical protein
VASGFPPSRADDSVRYGVAGSWTSMSNGDDLIGAFELHSVDRIRALLDSGLDVRAPIRGKTPVCARRCRQRVMNRDWSLAPQ